MLPPLTHPALRSAANLTTALGAANLLVLVLFCLQTSAALGPRSIPIHRPEIWIFCGLVTLLFPAPGVVLLSCANPIRHASKPAVTTALVFSSILAVLYSLGFVSQVIRFLSFLRFAGRLPSFGLSFHLLLTTSLLAASLANVIKLSRCYRVIHDLRYGGPR